MKINEASVIDIELLKDQVADLRSCEIFREFNETHYALAKRMRVINTIESIIESSKPLEPIVRNFHTYGQFAKMELLATGKINIHSVDQYINQTEI